MKRTLLAFSLLLGLLWLLPACKKDDDPGPSVIQGRLTDYGTAAPVKDAKIYLSCDESQFGGPPVSKLFDSLSTDADGRFYKEYPAGEFCANVVIQPYKKGYFVPTPLDYVTVPKSYDFVMDPESWLRVVTVPSLGGGRYPSLELLQVPLDGLLIQVMVLKPKFSVHQATEQSSLTGHTGQILTQHLSETLSMSLLMTLQLIPFTTNF